MSAWFKLWGGRIVPIAMGIVAGLVIFSGLGMLIDDCDKFGKKLEQQEREAAMQKQLEQERRFADRLATELDKRQQTPTYIFVKCEQPSDYPPDYEDDPPNWQPIPVEEFLKLREKAKPRSSGSAAPD